MESCCSFLTIAFRREPSIPLLTLANRCQIVRSRVLHNKEQCNHHIQQDDLQRACIRIRRRIDDVARCNRNDPDRRALQDQEKSCFYQLLLLAFIKTA